MLLTPYDCHSDVNEEFTALIEKISGWALCLDVPQLRDMYRQNKGRLHPNGFVKIPILKCSTKKTELSVRLHIWKRANTSTDLGNIHNHRWSMYSYLISGLLQNTEYSEEGSENREPYLRYSYTPGTALRKHTLLFQDVVSVGVRSLYSIGKGEYYSLDHSIFHRVEALKSWTATLVVCINNIEEKNSVSVLMPPGRSIDITVGDNR